MQQEYDEITGDLSDLSDDEMYFRHVVQEDHELLAVDMMLSNALSRVEE
jgi:hypothetical protein